MADHYRNRSPRNGGRQRELNDEAVRGFIDRFFEANDNNEADEVWTDMFTKDAQAIILDQEGNGLEGIRKLREWMKKAFPRRRHYVSKMFIGRFHEDGSEVEFMVQGQARAFPAGGEGEDKMQVLALMGHGVLRPDDGHGDGEEWKLCYYRAMLVKDEAEQVVQE